MPFQYDFELFYDCGFRFGVFLLLIDILDFHLRLHHSEVNSDESEKLTSFERRFAYYLLGSYQNVLVLFT